MSATRRDFLKASGLVVGFVLAPRIAFAQERLPGSLNGNRRLDAWLRIDPNGTVTIFTGKIELGQGIGTALSQIAADELDVDLERLVVVHGDTARTPNEGQTAGSLSVEQSGTALRFACAEARDILLTAAAAKLGVPAAGLDVSDGTITAPGGARVTYWELAADADLGREATAKVKPKPAAERRWVGRSIQRRDIPRKFTGGAVYVQDIRLPGMVFGRVVRPPSPGAELRSVDAIPLYEFANVKVVKHYITEAPLRTSALRTLGGYANVFALESFVDELAAAAGADPVEFRLRHTKDPRARAVIEAAAQRAGWQPGAKGDGARGRGVAFSRYKNLACYCALVADVAVDRASGRVRVTRVVAAVDAGQIVNPDGVINQIEGGIIQSASWTLKEAVRFDRTRVTTRSWADYPIVRFDEVPEVEVVLLDRPEERFLGVGEGSQGPAAAAIANAIAHATGRRLRALPFTPERVKQALA